MPLVQRDPRLNAVASLKLLLLLPNHSHQFSDPRLNAVASLKPLEKLLQRAARPAVIHGLMPWPH